MNDKVLKFKGKIIRKVYANEDYRVYGVEIDKTLYPELKLNRYGNITIVGDIGDLTFNVDYNITAKEENTKNGISYRVLNITRKKPTTIEDSFTFLSEVITEKQAKTLLDVYPNIIQKVINNDLDDIDFNKTKGIKEKTFEKIKNKIIDNICLAELVTEFKGYLSLSIIRKIYNKYPSVQSLKSKLKSNPYKCLCGLGGVGFKTADSILLEIEKVSNNNINNGKDPIIVFDKSLIESEERCLACVLYLLKKNEENGNTKANLVNLRSECLKLTPECIEHFTTVVKDKDIYLDKDNLEIALKKTYNTEKFICNNINQRLNKNNNTWDFNIYSYRNVNGIDLSDEQIELLRSVCDNNFTVLTAAGGCGKSFSTKALIDMLKDNGKSFILASPTGKAAKKLSQYTGEQANTIHKTLMYQEGKFQFNKDNKLSTDVLIVDEIGMTDIYLFKSLLEATSINTKIVLIGDSYQLNSVGCGALLRDLCNSKKIPHVIFNTVYRMGEGGVLTACTYVRQNHKFLIKNEFTQIGKDKSYSFIPSSKDKMNKMVLALYKKLLETNDVEDITVISSYNIGENGCDRLNQILQPIANPKSLTSKEFVKININKSEIRYYIGDMVIQNCNNYSAKLFLENEKTKTKTFIPNGTQGKVINIIDNDLIINFDGTIVYYSIDEIRQIKHSFALSVHKMQGSQNKIIVFCCPSSHMFFLSNNIIYTAISRAEKMVYHFSDVRTINIAMNKSDNSKRNTFLCDMLKGEI